MTALYIAAYSLLTLGIAALAIALVDRGRVVIRALGIDAIELMARYNQMLIDRDRQNNRLEAEDFAIRRLYERRQKLQEARQ